MKREHEEVALFIALVGGIALVARNELAESIEWGTGWHWPVPDLTLDDATVTDVRYPAEVSQEYKRGTHVGVDIMYRRRRGGPDATKYPAGVTDAGGARQGANYFAPPNTPILAARPARVWSVQKTAKGILVVLDHGKPWATMYAHLATCSLDPHLRGVRIGANMTPQEVDAGEQIGTMGHDPQDASKLRHLHFECWYKGHGNEAAKDPRQQMASWLRSEW